VDLDLRPTEHAFGAINATLLATTAVMLAIGCLTSWFVIAIVVLKRNEGHPAVPVWIAGALWSFVAFASIVALATVTVVPRLL
jgi:hypothetical protein